MAQCHSFVSAFFTSEERSTVKSALSSFWESGRARSNSAAWSMVAVPLLTAQSSTCPPCRLSRALKLSAPETFRDRNDYYCLR